jgi:hypothetical protein
MQNGVRGFFAKLGRREPRTNAAPTVVTERVRIVNPYHAVSIVAGPHCCEAVKAEVGRRYFSKDAPRVPVAKCNRPDCRCRYVHHDDRRAEPRRIADGRDAPPAAPYKGPERRLRSSGGRRELDETSA